MQFLQTNHAILFSPLLLEPVLEVQNLIQHKQNRWLGIKHHKQSSNLQVPINLLCWETCRKRWLQPPVMALAHLLVSAKSFKSIKSNRVYLTAGSLYPVLSSFLGGRSVPVFIYAHSGMGTALLTPLSSLSAV